MVLIPKLEDYDINVLIALGNQTCDVFTRNHLKCLIVEKIMAFGYSMFFLINKFLDSDKILKEAYAEVIIIKMKDCEYHIDDSVIDEILKLALIDTLMYYGAESPSLNFSKRCIEEFWNRGIEIEDKIELNKKSNLGKVKFKDIFKRKRKGE